MAVTSKLTINYGLRWEIYRPQTVTGAGKGGFVDVDTGEVLVAGDSGRRSRSERRADWKLFAPRLGMAYRITDKTVVRMGYGRGFDIGVFGSVFGHNVTQNLPVLGIQSHAAAAQLRCGVQPCPGAAPLDPATILNNQPKGPNGRPILPNGVTAFMHPEEDCASRPPINGTSRFSDQLPGNVAVEAAYVGTKGTHVFAGFGGDYDFNQATVNGFGTLTTNQRKPFFNKFGWSQNFRYYGSDASNNYHSMQMKAEKRFSAAIRCSLITRGRGHSTTPTPTTIRTQAQAYGPNDNHREPRVHAWQPCMSCHSARVASI